MIGPAYISLTSGPNAGQARPCIVTNEAGGLACVNVAVAKADLISNTGWLVLDKVRVEAIGATPDEAVVNGKKVADKIKAETEAAYKAAQVEVEEAAAAVAKAHRQIELAKEREIKANADAEKAAQDAAAHKQREADEKKRSEEAAKKVKGFKKQVPQPA